MGSVYFLESISVEDFAFLKDYSQVMVLGDENTAEKCYPNIMFLLPENHIRFFIPAGEKFKELHTCRFIWKEMLKYKLDRNSVLLNLGGGLVGDVGGFCASCFKRGIDFVQIPTTVLAQVDASIGGKTGIDFYGFKNTIGTFSQPKRVIISRQFLDTLPFRQLRSGYAEILKHALISDKALWEKLEITPLAATNWNEIIKRSVKIKNAIVQEDPHEKGKRKLLNFGHTIGHAIESYFIQNIPEKKDNSEILHGEAVALGIICEAWISWQKLGLKEEDFLAIEAKIKSDFPDIQLAKKDIEELRINILQDKKNKINHKGEVQILCTLLQDIGKGVFDQVISWEEVKSSLEYYFGYKDSDSLSQA